MQIGFVARVVGRAYLRPTAALERVRRVAANFGRERIRTARANLMGITLAESTRSVSSGAGATVL